MSATQQYLLPNRATYSRSSKHIRATNFAAREPSAPCVTTQRNPNRISRAVGKNGRTGVGMPSQHYASHEAHAVRSIAAAAAAAYARDDHAVLERDLCEVWPAERRAASRADEAV